jgi:hypothetical protein
MIRLSSHIEKKLERKDNNKGLVSEEVRSDRIVAENYEIPDILVSQATVRNSEVRVSESKKVFDHKTEGGKDVESEYYDEEDYDEEEETSTITLKVTKGTFPIDRVQIRVDGTAVANMSSQGPYKYTYTWSESDEDTKSISATIVDDGYYDAVITGSITRP